MNIKCFFLFFLLTTLFGCSVAKFVPENRVLYSSSSIEFSDANKVKDEKSLAKSIQNVLYVKPNSKFLGLWNTRLWIYYKFSDNHERGITKYLYDNYSEAPVYLGDIDTILLKNIVKKQMQDNGHFKSRVHLKKTSSKKKTELTYRINPGNITVIDSVRRPLPLNPVDSIAYSFPSYYLKKSEAYSLGNFQKERERFSKFVRSKGYFEFQENDVFYLVDTAKLDQSVSIIMKIKSPENDSLHRQFYIKDVRIYVKDFRSKADPSEIQKEIYQYRNYDIYDPYNYINKRTIERNVLIEENKLFNITDYELTLGRLLNLNVFKYVNIDYEKVAKDSLNVVIYLTPKDNKGIQLTAEANTSDRSFLGSNVSASFYNDNVLKKAERVSASLKFGSEFQLSQNILNLSILNANGQIKYEIPRILAPINIPKFRTRVPPKTIFKVEEDFQLWLQYFTKNSINASYGFEWERRPRQVFTFNPLFANLNTVFSTTAEFDSIVNNRPLLGISFQDNITFGSLLTYTYNSLQTRKFGHFFTYRTSIETAGNTANLINDIFTDNMNPEIFGIALAQYVKLDFEVRYTRGFNDKESLVTRLSTGIVNSYGSSNIAPFTKQYFIGGPTTLRGFQYRSVGPGGYEGQSNQLIANPIDQAGDIRLLFNTEYRFPIFSVFRGATFIDAGNVWLIQPDSSRPQTQFKFDEFYKEIALNTGFGLRIDIEYIALRLDLGIPIHDPSKLNGTKWIWQNGPSSLSSLYSDYMVLSGGIGYPF